MRRHKRERGRSGKLTGNMLKSLQRDAESQLQAQVWTIWQPNKHYAKGNAMQCMMGHKSKQDCGWSGNNMQNMNTEICHNVWLN